jgi:hypothetical protein
MSRRNADPTVIALLASGVSMGEAAATTGVSAKTIQRRMKDPEFLRRIDEARRALYEATLARLADAGTEAVGVLRALVLSGPPTVKLGAARCVLEVTPKWREHLDLEERLAELERLLPKGGA